MTAPLFLKLAGLLQDLDWKNFASKNMKTATFNQEFNNGNSGAGTVTVDLTVAQKQKVTLTGNCTIAFTAPNGPSNFVLKLIQDGTGTRTVTWPTEGVAAGNMAWVGSAKPTLTTTAAGVDIISIYYDGSVYWASYGLNFG